MNEKGKRSTWHGESIRFGTRGNKWQNEHGKMRRGIRFWDVHSTRRWHYKGKIKALFCTSKWISDHSYWVCRSPGGSFRTSARFSAIFAGQYEQFFFLKIKSYFDSFWRGVDAVKNNQVINPEWRVSVPNLVIFLFFHSFFLRKLQCSECNENSFRAESGNDKRHGQGQWDWKAEDSR